MVPRPGTNSAWMLHVADAASVWPAQVCDTMPNLSASPPVIWTPSAGIVTEAPPVLVTVIGSNDVSVPTAVVTDGTGSGAKDSAGGTPVPVSGTTVGLPGALLAICRLPDRLPLAVGLNST